MLLRAVVIAGYWFVQVPVLAHMPISEDHQQPKNGGKITVEFHKACDCEVQ